MPTDIETDPQAATPETLAPAARSRRARPVTVDAVLAAAVDLARDAALEVAEGDGVGEHLGGTPEGDRVITHLFACTCPGYLGWQWAVTLARAPRSRVVTVSEVHLLPGPKSVVSPTWVPWADRIAPGDVGPGTVLPLRVDDPMLEQGFEATGDEDVDRLAFFELGLGRPRVLSRLGRDAAAQRWYDGSHGPHDPHAEQAPAPCRTCGYFVPMAGALRQVFGVCTSEWSPSDGSVVSLDHGCGAHSEAGVEVRPEPLDAPVLDELGYEDVVVERRPVAPAADAEVLAELELADAVVMEPGPAAPADDSVEADLPELSDPVPDEAPVDDAPVDVAPVDEAPVDEAPVDETPVDETVEDSPQQDAPVEDAAGPAPEAVEPLPMPSPEPIQPEPMPSPEPIQPEPMPQPGPEPMPQPGPEPTPQPGPEPYPQPQPEPLPGTTQPGSEQTGPDAPPEAAPTP